VIDSSADLRIYPLQCSTPQAVALSGFDAQPVPLGILLTWSTAFEFAHAGFNVHRAFSSTGEYGRINPTLVTCCNPYRLLDEDVRPNTTYFYRLEAVDRSGSSELFGPVAGHSASVATNSHRTRLEHLRPNPFGQALNSATTEIRFEMDQPGRATLRVFDAAGRMVRCLLDDHLDAGTHRTSWDGRNEGGEPVTSGVYFCRLDAGAVADQRSIVWLR